MRKGDTVAEHNYHLIHVDDKKQTAIVSFVGEPDDEPEYDALLDHLSSIIDMDHRETLFVNIIPFNAYDLRIVEQRAVVDFILVHTDHADVERFILHFNATEGDLARLFLLGGDQQAHTYFIEEPIRLINEILVDAMLKQVHA